MTLATAGALRAASGTALAVWNREAATRLRALGEVPRGREEAMDARRRREALLRTQEVVNGLRTRRRGPQPSPRAVLVHRSAWVRRGLAALLTDAGVTVVGEAEDGAVGLAYTVVEQPQLLLLEDHLPWVTAVELVGTAKVFAPGTRIVVQAEDGVTGDACLGAGATAVYGRTLPLPELNRRCLALLEGA